MSPVVPTKIDPLNGLVLNLQGVAAWAGDVAFDSYLIKHEDGHNNHTLTLVLKIHLDPILPASIRFPRTLRMLYPDWDKTPLLIQPWRMSQWSHFKILFMQECARWNNNFWLIPPADYSTLDVKLGGRTVRPNVYCHLYVELTGTVAGSHRSIVVVSLDKEANSFFRSDALHYSSDDVNSEDSGLTDDHGKPLPFYTVTHEVGHALGLPHIGETYNDPLCRMAILVGDKLPKSLPASLFLPAIVQGGIASACYGVLGPPNQSKNVMGMGSLFEASNAQPWLDRLAQHLGTDTAKWNVSMNLLPPKNV